MKKIKTIAFCVFFIAFFVCGSNAADAPKAQSKNTPDKTASKKEPTKEEMEKYIKELLDNRSDVAALVPGLEKQADPSGDTFYLYNGVSLASMDKDQLRKLLNTVNGAVAQINNERLAKQIDNMRQADQAVRSAQQAAARQASIPASVTQPPVVYSPPLVRPASQNVSQPPKPPAAPPAPPRR